MHTTFKKNLHWHEIWNLAKFGNNINYRLEPIIDRQLRGLCICIVGASQEFMSPHPSLYDSQNSKFKLNIWVFFKRNRKITVGGKSVNYFLPMRNIKQKLSSLSKITPIWYPIFHFIQYILNKVVHPVYNLPSAHTVPCPTIPFMSRNINDRNKRILDYQKIKCNQKDLQDKQKLWDIYKYYGLPLLCIHIICILQLIWELACLESCLKSDSLF